MSAGGSGRVGAEKPFFIPSAVEDIVIPLDQGKDNSAVDSGVEWQGSLTSSIPEGKTVVEAGGGGGFGLKWRTRRSATSK